MYKVATCYFADKNVAANRLSYMHDIANRYGVVTVSDYYDTCFYTRYPSTHLDNKYGWTDSEIHKAVVVNDRPARWHIELPEAILLPDDTDESIPNPSTSTPEPLYITVHVNEIDVYDPDEILADVFKYVYTIKDRAVHLNIT